MESLHSLRGKVLDGQATLLAPSQEMRETIRLRLLGRQDLTVKNTEADNLLFIKATFILILLQSHALNKIKYRQLIKKIFIDKKGRFACRLKKKKYFFFQ